MFLSPPPPFFFQRVMVFKMKSLEDFRFSLETTEIEGQKTFERSCSESMFTMN